MSRAAQQAVSAGDPPDLDADIESLIAAGETVAAVRLVRTRLGLDLTEAKLWVDARRASASPSPASGDIGSGSPRGI